MEPHRDAVFHGDQRDGVRALKVVLEPAAVPALVVGTAHVGPAQLGLK